MPNSLLEPQEQRIPWFQDPGIRLALATILVPGLYRILAAAGVPMPLSQERLTEIAVDSIMFAGGLIWIIRRIKRGKDPSDPAPTITIK